jgi:hypothetical protein
MLGTFADTNLTAHPYRFLSRIAADSIIVQQRGDASARAGQETAPEP